jgi:hypothetical protein
MQACISHGAICKTTWAYLGGHTATGLDYVKGHTSLTFDETVGWRRQRLLETFFAVENYFVSRADT